MLPWRMGLSLRCLCGLNLWLGNLVSPFCTVRCGPYRVSTVQNVRSTRESVLPCVSLFFSGGQNVLCTVHTLATALSCFVRSTPSHSAHAETNTSYRFYDWSAYSISGDVSGRIYYVNTGSISDFEYLLSLSNVNLTGAIGLFRSGQSTSARIINAYNYGLKAVISWNDIYPNQTQVYPYGPYVPKSGYRLGAIRTLPCAGNLSPERLIDRCGLNLTQTEDVFPSIKVECLPLYQYTLNGRHTLFCCWLHCVFHGFRRI